MPPLLKMLRLGCLRHRAMWRTLPHLADAPSKRAFVRAGWRGTPTNANAPLVELRIKDLGGERIWCRSGLSDLGVVYDTFFGRYHLPPEEIGAPRTILDLGSNIGLTIAHMAAAFPQARILGAEMDQGNWSLCRKNVAVFDERCEVLHAAVWHEPGEVSYSGVRESGYTIANNGGNNSAEAVTVGALIDRLGVDQVDYVKMDIEGAEQEVLREGSSWAARVRCLKVEVHPAKRWPLYTIGACIEDLEKLGFECTLDARHHAGIIARRTTILEQEPS